ncbi:MAG: serine hydrolase domain-containing protein [Bacteroidota bacterium]|nr:serine hydrolase domain-containing protein [Bacteroidota bacterium]
MNQLFCFKVPYHFYIVLSLFLLSCGENQPVSTTEKTPAINQDSINKILKNIHASEKSKQLNVLFENKVKTIGFNGCILIAQQGQIIYKNVFGFSNLKTKDSLKINSAFQLASTSKTLTAAAILLLKDQGKLNLSDNIQRFLPNFPYHNITVQTLLTHRSGLSNYIYFGEPYCDAKNCYNGKTFDNNSVIQIMMSDKPQPYASPNKKFEYCNTNYALLASIVEKVSGLSFADFMVQNIFKPLEMNNTWVHNPQNDSIFKNKTVGHNASGYMEKETYADDVVGDKGIYSTVEDLFKWDQALYSERILKRSTIEEAFTGYSNEHKGKRNYGYGWRLIDEGKGNKVVYHNGWWHGYSTLFYRRLSDQTTVILLSNKYNSNIYHIEDVLSILNNDSKKIKIFGRK